MGITGNSADNFYLLEKTNICGQSFDVCTTATAIREIDILIESGETKIASCINVYILTECYKNKELSEFYNNCDLMTVDGRPLVYVSKFIGERKFPEMIGGPNLSYNLLEHSINKGYLIYLWGATDIILEKAIRNIREQYKGIKIVGWNNGYCKMDTEDFKKNVDRIKELKPDIIFIGIPTPIKEKVSKYLKDNLEQGLIITVGGLFDVFAGEKKVGNKFVSYLLLDWILRMAQEPKRLFWRYVKSNSFFMYMILREVINKFRFN